MAEFIQSKLIYKHLADDSKYLYSYKLNNERSGQASREDFEAEACYKFPNS